MSTDLQRAPYRDLHLEQRLVDIDQPAPGLDWIVSNVAARGLLTILSGEGGIGKTSLALQFAADVGDRHLWGPAELRAYPERSAFFSSENVGALHTLTEAMGIGSRSVAIFEGGGINLASEADVNGMALSLARRRVTLVVLDSLRQFAPGKDESGSNDMAPYIGGLSKLAEVTGCAVVLLHHFNRSAAARGSSAIRDQADFTLSLGPTSQENVLRLSPDKWRLGAKPAPWFVKREVQRQDVAGRTVELLQYSDVGHPVRRPVTDDLVAALRALPPRVWSTAELYTELSLNGETSRDRERLSQARKPLLETGELEQISQGRYRRSDNLTTPD